MIQINLLPKEFRRERTSPILLIQQKKHGRILGFVFLLLTLLFYIQYHMNLGKLRALREEWASLQGDVGRVTGLKNQIDSGGKKEKQFLEDYVTSPFPATAILSAVSTFLPDSIWLVELKISRRPNENTFLVKGFSLPKQKHSGIQDIEAYLRALKEGFPPETDLLLTTSRQVKEEMELTLFTAVFKWA